MDLQRKKQDLSSASHSLAVEEEVAVLATSGRGLHESDKYHEPDAGWHAL